MTLKRIVLSVLTLIVALVMGGSLISSFSQPQVGNQLQLYQTDLSLQASEWNGSGLPDAEVQQFRQAVFGEDALDSAIEQYNEVRTDAATGLLRLEQLVRATPDIEKANSLATTAKAQKQLIDQLDLRLGVVKAKQGRVADAIQTWEKLADRSKEGATATLLSNLWQDAPTVPDNAADLINTQLRGWFRYIALNRLYTLQNKPEQLTQLNTTEASQAESTLIQLSVVGILPSFGALLGTALLIALIGQRVLRGKASLLFIEDGTWEVPWNWEVVWLVIVGGFLFTGQLVVPLVISGGVQAFTAASSTAASSTAVSGASASVAGAGLALIGSAIGSVMEPLLGLTNRSKALYSLTIYVVMSLSTLGIMYFAIKAFLPLSKEWFRVQLSGRWALWGLGGYFVALPLMLGVSLLNQQIWQGQGGNNPLLQIVLEERDPIALGLFLFTAAVAAPVFEEILFRGFLLPSLTRYFPTWGAIGLSSVIFSVAHLSFSEVLPLSVLGAILGFVYARSRNLMSSILLHSTWNSITMIGLFLLGSGG
ncbi:MAG: type II CAAX endopeptidase family protein [Cyanobacteria bacterium J06554_3]